MTSPPALLERADELAELHAAMADARSGRGALVLVSGEAGSGKTSLVTLAVRDVVPVVTGWCEPLRTPRPLGPLLDVAAALGESVERRDHHELYASLLHRLRRPVVVVVEDLHWSDEGTLDFLRFVAPRLARLPSTVICTMRDDEIDAEHPVRSLLGDLAKAPTVRRVEVRPLSLDAVVEMCDGRPMDAARIHRMTGGNPFFVSEVVATDAEVPPSVADAVLARLARLDEGARAVAEVVAIAPRELSVERALAASGEEAGAVDGAVAGGVLVAERAHLRYRHELARAAVEASLPPERRIERHRALLALVERTEPVDLPLLVHHAIHGAVPDLVVRSARSAARQARDRLSPKQAVEFVRAALEHAEQLDGDEIAALHLDLAGYLRTAGGVDEAAELADRVVAHRRVVGEPEGLAEALIVRSVIRWGRRDPGAARVDVDEAIDVLSHGDPTPALLDALDQSAFLRMLAREGTAGRHDVARHRAVARRLGVEPSALSEQLDACLDLSTDRPDAGIDRLHRLRERARADGDRVLEIEVDGMLASGGGEVRRYDVALEALEAGRSLAADRGLDSWLDYHEAWGARIAFEQGRWDDATASLDRTPSPFGFVASTALGALGRVRVRRGDPGAREALERAIEANHGGELQHEWSPACGLAELAWLNGRADEAIGAVAAVHERALSTESPWARGETGFWMWRAGAIDAPPAGSAEPFALQMAGDWSGAAERWRSIGCPYEVGLALLDGDVAGVSEALSIFEGLGARPAVDLVRARLRELGVATVPRGPQSRTLANPAGLTARQLEVLVLIVSGLDNGEIADRLHVAKKTVEHHVSAIFSKLGVRGRTKAIAEARRLGID